MAQPTAGATSVSAGPSRRPATSKVRHPPAFRRSDHEPPQARRARPAAAARVPPGARRARDLLGTRAERRPAAEPLRHPGPRRPGRPLAVHGRATAATAPAAGVIRRLGPGERDLLPGHFLRLSAEDRHLRFGGRTGEERIRAYCARLAWPPSVVLGYLVDGVPRAVGELKPIAGPPPFAAELAVSVEAPFRGRGVGTELCRRLLVRARNRLIARVHMLCLLDNRSVQRIARGLGGALAFHPGEVEAEIGLPWPQPFSLAEEWLDEVPPRPWPDGGRAALTGRANARGARTFPSRRG